MSPMPLDPLFAGACLAGFVALVTIAAASDIATMTIPNWVSIAAALLFPLAGWLAGLSAAQIGLHLGVGVFVFALGFALFSFGVLGGGDVKVITAVSIWTGLAALMDFAFAMTLAGGALAAGLLLARKAVRPADSRPAFLNRLLDPARGIPYAVAIAIGAAVSLPSQPVAQALLAP
jgi:prepilin peptidase CpaA